MTQNTLSIPNATYPLTHRSISPCNTLSQHPLTTHPINIDTFSQNTLTQYPLTQHPLSTPPTLSVSTTRFLPPSPPGARLRQKGSSWSAFGSHPNKPVSESYQLVELSCSALSFDQQLFCTSYIDDSGVTDLLLSFHLISYRHVGSAVF